jgi:uncharacterized protein YbdZ (MbtH family)
MADIQRDEQEDTTIYKVVVNHEEQYSIWPAERDNPSGWRDAGKSGRKEECLGYIEEVWTDMRPLSLRQHMQEMAQRPPAPPPAEPSRSAQPAAPSRTGNDLVDRLSTGDHPIEASLRPDRMAQRLQEQIDRGFVHIKFTGTQGGTELGIRLDPARSDYQQADFVHHTGTVRLVGELTLNYVKVRCIAHLDLATLSGQGHLEPVEG